MSETIGSLIAYQNRKRKIWFDTYVFDDLQPMSREQAQEMIDGWAQVEWKMAKEQSPYRFAEMVACQTIRAAFSSADKKHQINCIRNALSFVAGRFGYHHSIMRLQGCAFWTAKVVSVDLQYILQWQQPIIDHRLSSRDDSVLFDGLTELLRI